MPADVCALNGWSRTRRRLVVALYAASVLAMSVWLAWRLKQMFTQPDTSNYLNMAAGKPAMLPFAWRQLGPLLVRGLSHLAPLSIQTSFIALGIVSLLFFSATVAYLLVESGAPRWMLGATAGLVFWGIQFNDLVMPDLLYAALMCAFLLLLRAERFLWAAALLFPMAVTRESTGLTLACLFLAGWRQLRRQHLLAAVAASAAGMLVVRWLAAGALPNRENLSPLLYLLAKMPWNFLRNVLGFGAWANVYPTCAVPHWQVAVHMGPLRAVGSCGFAWWLPVQTLGTGLSIFGLLPLLLWCLRKTLRPAWSGGSVMMRFALLYGGVSMAMAPLLGKSFSRLFGYGWPLFLVALPILLGASAVRFRQRWMAVAFVAIQFAVSWSLLNRHINQILTIGLASYGLGWVLLQAGIVVAKTPLEAGVESSGIRRTEAVPEPSV